MQVKIQTAFKGFVSLQPRISQCWSGDTPLGTSVHSGTAYQFLTTWVSLCETAIYSLALRGTCGGESWGAGLSGEVKPAALCGAGVRRTLWLERPAGCSAEAAAARPTYWMYCWRNSIQLSKAPTKRTDTTPILVRIGCQYNHLFLFRSASFSFCFICCTFWAVVAFLSSRMRFRRMLWTEKNTWKDWICGQSHATLPLGPILAMPHKAGFSTHRNIHIQTKICLNAYIYYLYKESSYFSL